MNKGNSFKTIQLHDGRILTYSEYGKASDKTLFYFHGGADSRLEAGLWAKQAERAGIHLIGIDRPGMGMSHFKAGRSLLDWPDDVVELADNLQINNFSIVGVSGGGPYALACAYKIPDRLTSCGVVAGEGPQTNSLLTQWLPYLMYPIMKRFFQNKEQAQKTMLRFTRNWPEPDRKCLAHSEILGLMATSLVEGMHQGAKGAAYDGFLVKRPWGFKLEEITFPALYLWHGELDKDVSVEIGRDLAEKLIQCKATFYPNEGHISLIINRQVEILTTLMS